MDSIESMEMASMRDTALSLNPTTIVCILCTLFLFVGVGWGDRERGKKKTGRDKREREMRKGGTGKRTTEARDVAVVVVQAAPPPCPPPTSAVAACSCTRSGGSMPLHYAPHKIAVQAKRLAAGAEDAQAKADQLATAAAAAVRLMAAQKAFSAAKKQKHVAQDALDKCLASDEVADGAAVEAAHAKVTAKARRKAPAKCERAATAAPATAKQRQAGASAAVAAATPAKATSPAIESDSYSYS